MDTEIIFNKKVTDLQLYKTRKQIESLPPFVVGLLTLALAAKGAKYLLSMIKEPDILPLSNDWNMYTAGENNA